VEYIGSKKGIEILLFFLSFLSFFSSFSQLHSTRLDALVAGSLSSHNQAIRLWSSLHTHPKKETETAKKSTRKFHLSGYGISQHQELNIVSSQSFTRYLLPELQHLLQNRGQPEINLTYLLDARQTLAG